MNGINVEKLWDACGQAVGRLREGFGKIVAAVGKRAEK